MSMGQRENERQRDLWLPTTDLARSPGHPFYEQVNRVLREAEFDEKVEELCRPFYADSTGRPSIPPGVYFRMLLIGYFEGLGSEREIAWRCADSLALRDFLGYALDEATPNHSSLCRIRQRLDVEVHEAVFSLVLEILSDRGLLRGKTIGIDSTTLEANAALRSIVRRDDGTGYEEFLKKLAKESGIKTPTRKDLAKLDRKRPKKGSNEEWEHPGDPDAQITKMKDGRTHLAHKSEHAVDMDSGAVVAVSLHGGAAGDTQTIYTTMEAACEEALALGLEMPREWIADKGYHCNETMEMVAEVGLRSYISEPDRGKRRWKGKDTARRGTNANRRRIRGARGRRLMRRRGEISGTQLCPLPGVGRHAQDLAPKSSEHPQALSRARRSLQSRDRHATDPRGGNAEGAGGLAGSSCRPLEHPEMAREASRPPPGESRHDSNDLRCVGMPATNYEPADRIEPFFNALLG